MTVRKKIWLTFAGIIALVILAGVIDFPQGPNIRPGKDHEVKVHLGLDLQGGTHLVYDADTQNIPAVDKADALDGVRDVIERRINAFGVAEPLIQTNKSGNNWRVIVELAGIKDVDQAIALIGQTPVLDFREEAPLPEPTEEAKAAATAFNSEQKAKAQEVLDQAQAKDADFAALANENSQDPGNAKTEIQEKLGGDLGFFGRAVMVAEFDQAVFDQLAVGEVTKDLVETQYGYHIIKKTDERKNDKGEVEARASHILFLKQNPSSAQAVDPYANYKLTGLSGKHLAKAQVIFDPNSQQPQISLKFNDEGKKLFGEVTTRNVNKVVGIFLDGTPISLPKVNEAITSGEAVITGDFTLPEAKQLAQRLNAGALPVPIKLVGQQTIGASLGERSIQQSLLAGLIGLSVVCLFMICFYRLPGLLASLALVIYALLVLAIFKLWPVTLTLAGIAGFILSIGMAIDANVLIFERLKEELREGKSLISAVDEGFRRAWLSIRDSNVSSLITCLILFWFGASVVKGFALTLGLGILVSMFSAIIVTRTFLRLVIGQQGRNPWWFGGNKRE